MGVKSVANLGPGAYDANPNLTKASNPTYKFSKGQKGLNRRDISPGPGVYSPGQKTIGTESTKITMSGKPKSKKQDDLPGPGAYDRPSAF